MLISLEENVKKYFGFNEFRPYQKEIVQHILDKQDVVAILPTGSGKSLCYQLPALLQPGITIVVSPLISLMQDQVLQLTRQGIAATFLNSSLDAQERDHVLYHLDDYKLIYVSPERLVMDDFRAQLKRQKISSFIIDEAHCISQWGHSFRAEYRNLAHIKHDYPGIPIAAFTATATLDVEKDIATQLGMTRHALVKGSFDRENLLIRIQEKNSYEQQLLDFLKDRKGESGIIYASSRKRVEKIHETLVKLGFLAEKYHAGMTDTQRSLALKNFIHERVDIVVATVAFGMGINKSNVRFVYHVDMPQNMEQYYQEIGRAGRDGLPSTCVMLYSLRDVMLQKRLLDEIPNETVRHHMRRKSEQILAMCNSADCRRKDILRYFGETYDQHRCNNCDNCLDDIDMIDGTITAQKILSCVYRLHSRFGINYVIDVLKGSSNKLILQRRHDTLSTYGIMKDEIKTDIRQYIFTLINMGYLDVSDGDYPVLQLTPNSRDILVDKKPIQFRKARVKAKKEGKASKQKTGPQHLGNVDQNLFKELKALRRTIADKANVPPYIIFHDRTLLDMAAVKPKTNIDFLTVNGVGPQKLEKYGSPFLALLNKWDT